MKPLLLASSSPYRRALLTRLGMAFEWAAPDLDEAALDGETPEALATRLAEAKARALADRFPAHYIIGSDQVAAIDGITLGKPGGIEAAMAQLMACSGRRLRFSTAVCVYDSSSGLARTALDQVDVQFRPLNAQEIDRYLQTEQPWDCAGSFKCEGLGISLFEWIRSDDPTSLEGLPLIALCRLLREAGFTLP